MSKVYFTSDWHLGHVNIPKFRPWVKTEEENTQLLCDNYASLVTKRDTVYFLGDICFTENRLTDLKKLPGRKFLIRGNHDYLTTKQYLEVFEEVYGILSYKGFWLSHCPVHPNELRNRKNIHGHVHTQTVEDQRYFNVCVDRFVEKQQPYFLTSLEYLHTIAY